MGDVKDGNLRKILANMQTICEYHAEKLRIYEEHLTELTGTPRPELTDSDKRRLAQKGKALNNVSTELKCPDFAEPTGRIQCRGIPSAGIIRSVPTKAFVWKPTILLTFKPQFFFGKFIKTPKSIQQITSQYLLPFSLFRPFPSGGRMLYHFLSASPKIPRRLQISYPVVPKPYTKFIPCPETDSESHKLGHLSLFGGILSKRTGSLPENRVNSVKTL